VTRDFYIKYLGAKEIARPPFEAEGFWLHIHGLNLHLVQTKRVQERKEIKQRRMEYFLKAFVKAQEPSVDHFAFICKYDTAGLTQCESSLSKEKIEFFKFGGPNSLTGITQLFIFDPDGNVVEISDCAPPCGMIRCLKSAQKAGLANGNLMSNDIDADLPPLSHASVCSEGGFWGGQ